MYHNLSKSEKQGNNTWLDVDNEKRQSLPRVIGPYTLSNLC